MIQKHHFFYKRFKFKFQISMKFNKITQILKFIFSLEYLQF